MADRWHVSLVLEALLALLLLQLTAALDNGVGKTPAMGWNSWNTFRCNINETLIKEVADALVASGLRDAGYQYVNIDDCWMASRDAAGILQPNATKFPSGMKALGDYIHARGLKFGIYSDAGNTTCEGYPASWGHEQQDAKTFAEWGVDYLKYDYCGMDAAKESTEVTYTRMSKALLATGRPILFSLCSWGAGAPWEWGAKVGHSWRVSADAFAAWDKAHVQELALPTFLISTNEAVEAAQQHAKFAGPGGFNDADMLVVGLDGMYPYGIVQKCPPHVVGCKPGEYISRERWGMVGGLSLTQQRTHFALYCMLASPLILGNDPRHMRREIVEILTAPDVIKIHQDPLGKQAVRRIKEQDNHGIAVWVKELSGPGRVAVLLVNHGNRVQDFALMFQKHLPDLHARWARTLHNPPPPPCLDRKPECVGWAASGECERNPGFMMAECQKSCPKACQRDDKPQVLASALVRDAWSREELGLARGHHTALHLDPYEGRLLVLTFMEPDAAAAAAQQQQQQPRYADTPSQWPAPPLLVPSSMEPGATGARESGEVAALKAAAQAAEERTQRLSKKVNELSAELAAVKGQPQAGDSRAAAAAQAGKQRLQQQQQQADAAAGDGRGSSCSRSSWWSLRGGGSEGASSMAVMLVVTNAIWVLLLVAGLCGVTLYRRRVQRYKLVRYVH